MKKPEDLLPLSETMHYILLALREPLHGYALMEKIRHMSEHEVIIAPGTLYGALNNLHKHGCIEHVRQDGRKNVYQISHQGQDILRQERHRLLRVSALHDKKGDLS